MIKTTDTLILDKEEFEKLDYCESFQSQIETYFGKDREVNQVIIILEDKN
jgi:hypothetical protein